MKTKQNNKGNIKKVGILGLGEVGKAIASFYDSPYIQDINSTTFPVAGDLDILHVCIPAKGNSAMFAAHVVPVIKKYCNTGLVIIHSTVPVGTTELIGKEHRLIVHSPVRGVHPNIAEGIKVFVKYIGADNPTAGRLAAEHLESLKINVKVVHKSRSTELLKLLDTTYYGLCIAFHAYASKLCLEEKVPPLMVLSHANYSYNTGYSILGKHNVIRPVLLPPENDKIGGHCIIPNAEILLRQFGNDPVLQAILRHK